MEGSAGIPRADGMIWWKTSRDFVQIPQGHGEENTCVLNLHQPQGSFHATALSNMLLPCNIFTIL